MLVKNLTTTELVTIMPIRLAMDVMAAYVSLFTGKFKDYWAIARAHLYFFTHLGNLLSKRKQYRRLIEQTRIGEPTQSGRFRGSLIWQFFIKGRKKFSDLPQERFL